MFDSALNNVATPYVTTFRVLFAVLPARNNDTPVFGLRVTLALVVVLLIIVMVEPFAKGFIPPSDGI